MGARGMQAATACINASYITWMCMDVIFTRTICVQRTVCSKLLLKMMNQDNPEVTWKELKEMMNEIDPNKVWPVIILSVQLPKRKGKKEIVGWNCRNRMPHILVLCHSCVLHKICQQNLPWWHNREDWSGKEILCGSQHCPQKTSWELGLQPTHGHTCFNHGMFFFSFAFAWSACSSPCKGWHLDKVDHLPPFDNMELEPAVQNLVQHPFVGAMSFLHN